MGNVRYGDFVSEDDDFSVTTKNDFAWGLGTSVEFAPESWNNWAINTGVKYLDSSIEFKNAPGEVDVNPLIWRTMLVYRW